MKQFTWISLLVWMVAVVASGQERPNVLMIAIDDLNDWVGCLGGHPDAKTPNLDALAERGRNCSNAHCSVPVCSPSRVSVMSGLAPTTIGSYELGPAYESIPSLDSVPCMQEFFQQQGYVTLAGGKILHHGFRGRLAKNIDISLSTGKRKGGPRPKERMNWPLPVWDWGAFPETDGEMDDYQLAEAAAEALGKSYEKPFFMSVGLFRPHVPMHVPSKWFALYDRESIRMPDASPQDLDDVPPNFQYKMGIAPTLEEFQAANKWRSLVHAYLANVSFADHCLGTILAGLDQGPHRDNTLVVLWSDHGFHLGEKQHVAKRTLWEESTRVPLIIAGPGIAPGACREAVSLLDIYPTLVERCGLPMNALLEGISLVPQLLDPATVREEPAITSSYFGNHAVRTREWRYIRYADGAEELYDHRSDPAEHLNLAGNAAYAAVRQQLARWIPKHAAPEIKPAAQQEQVRAGR